MSSLTVGRLNSPFDPVMYFCEDTSVRFVRAAESERLPHGVLQLLGCLYCPDGVDSTIFSRIVPRNHLLIVMPLFCSKLLGLPGLLTFPVFIVDQL